MLAKVGGSALGAVGKLDVVLCNEAHEDDLDDFLHKEPARAGMGPAAPWQHGVLEGGKMELCGVALLPHAFPALGVEVGGVGVEVWIASEKPAGHDDGRAGWDSQSVFEGVVFEGPALHGVWE